jgi:hypothetical protein
MKYWHEMMVMIPIEAENPVVSIICVQRAAAEVNEVMINTRRSDR